MTNEELIKNRFNITFEALNLEIHIEYKLGWFLFLQDEQLYQVFYKDDLNKVIHKSIVTLNDFIGFVNSMGTDQLKRIYADIKLRVLQNRLLDNYGKNQQEE